MTRESKAILLALLALLLYALSILVTDGKLIFPFPMNKAVFAVFIFQFCYWEKQLGLKLLFPILIALLGLSSSQYIWEIVLPQGAVKTLYDSPAPDILNLLFLLTMVFSAVAMVRQQEKWQMRALGIFGTGLFVIGYTISNIWYEFPGTVFIAASVLLEPTYKPWNKLWLLFAGLETTEVITYLVN